MNFEEKLSLLLFGVFGINSLAELNTVMEFILLSLSIVGGIIGLIKHWRNKRYKK